MAASRDDDERSGYGARRGWRAPKGTGGPPRRRGRGGPRRATPPGGTADEPVDPEGPAARIARLAGLGADEAAALADAELPAPGAPDLLPAALQALGGLVRSARETTRAADDRADQADERRARDAARAQDRIGRADERRERQAAKAAQEQGERQRLAGELERSHARLSQVSAERDRLRELADAAGGPEPADRGDAEVAGLLARVADLEHLRGAARRLRRLALEAGALDVDLVDPDDHGPLRVDDLPAVRTVLQAVELAAAHAQHLVYTDRAFSSARTAPYDEPRKLLRDLVALDRVAAAWAVPGGTGRPIRDVAVAQQLEWADDVSVTARNQNPREYRFTHQGRPLWAGPHVRVATGRGLQRTCRIYLALVKGGEPDLAGLPRGIYVGPVGRHLSDSTSG